MDQNIIWALSWVATFLPLFLLLGFLSDSFTDFIRPVYIIAQIVAGAIPIIFTYDYMQRYRHRHRELLLPFSRILLVFTLMLSLAWSMINLKFIQAAFCLWSLFVHSSPIFWHALPHKSYSNISFGNSLTEILIGILICVLELWAAFEIAMALEREEVRALAEAEFHYLNANRWQRLKLTRAQVEEKRSKGDFGKLLTEEGFVKDGA